MVAMAASELVLRDRFLYCNDQYAETVASALLSGRGVSFATGDFPDRCVTERLIAGWTQPKDIVAVGSSRTMQIKQALFTSQSFYNASLWAARLSDYFAVIDLLARNDRLPKTFIIGLDPHSVDAFDDDPRWIPLADRARGALFASALALDGKSRAIAVQALVLNVAETIKTGTARLLGHLSLASLGQTVRFIRGCWCLDRYEGAPRVMDSMSSSEHLLKLPDGSVIYQEELRARTREELRRAGLAQARIMLKGPHAISNDKIAQLRVLIERLRALSVEPVIWLAPFGPAEFALIEASPNGTMVTELEALLRKDASASGYRIVGSYDPRRIPCTEAQFIDWWHPDAECVARAFAG
jgi:hypothetical protein